MNAVFDIRPGSRYGNDIAERYPFANTRNNVELARSVIGDWAVIRETQESNGRGAYIAVARVASVDAELGPDGLRSARLVKYALFPRPVPFARNGSYWESDLRILDAPTRVGQKLHGRPIRILFPDDFGAIVREGLSATLASEDARRLNLGDDYMIAPIEYGAPGFAEDVKRPVEQLLVNRKFRDANFRLLIRDAYDNRCAVTGLRILDRGGQAEVQAAHITPVALGGPDTVQNGIALSATIHWLFDHHLISIDEDYRLLVLPKRVPPKLKKLFRPEAAGLHLPDDRRLRPHPDFIAHHREIFASKA